MEEAIPRYSRASLKGSGFRGDSFQGLRVTWVIGLWVFGSRVHGFFGLSQGKVQSRAFAEGMGVVVASEEWFFVLGDA